MSLGLVCIIGRPNVGKSTLFNRLTKSNKSLIDDQPGVTRDSIFGHVEYDDHEFTLVDTGGFEKDDFCFQPFKTNIVWQQTVSSIEQSDAIICLFDGKTGLNTHDFELVKIARQSKKPVIYAINKIDNPKNESAELEFYELGVDNFILTSSAHSKGLEELNDQVIEILASDHMSQKKSDDNFRKLAIIGRPNVGKSSLLNRLCGKDRSIVSAVSGTTRDPVDEIITFNNHKYKIIDTAGMRRRTKIHDKLEILSSIRSFRAIQNADIVLLMISAENGFTDQDARLANFALKEHKPTLLVINKWDLMEKKSTNLQKKVTESISRQLGKYQFVPIFFMSCLTNYKVHQIMEPIESLWQESNKRVNTSEVNNILQHITNKHSPILNRGLQKRPRFYYATQYGIMPPRFIIKCNVSNILQESYKRFILNQFKSELNFKNVPIKVVYRDKKSEKKRKP